MRRQEFATLIAALGLWLFASSLIFVEAPSKMLASDLTCGLVLVVLATFSLRKSNTAFLWLVAILGLWIQFAPLALWANQTWQYVNGTLCGFIAMAGSLRALYPRPLVGQDDVAPPGWSHNPSAWRHRLPVIFLALLCSFFARYMSAVQLGMISSIWDPVFGDGTYKVITSTISKSFPVSDAGLGALAYTIEALMGVQGDSQRWRTMPWAVMAFGLLVVPVSMVSTLLIISQPVVVGAWCFWCLLTALLMIMMIPLAVAEFVAGLRFLYQNYKKKQPLWRLLWNGETSQVKVLTTNFQARETHFPPPGVTLPWNLIMSGLLGLAVVFSVHLLHPPKLVANSDYIIGLLVFAVSVISMAEVVRAFRFLNVIFGFWLALAPWLVFSQASPLTLVTQTLLSLAILLLSLRCGPIRQRYGTWQRFIF